ncbi:MAG: DUF4010 domain-containing protein, partial [Verrucomicrobiota bacterium]
MNTNRAAADKTLGGLVYQGTLLATAAMLVRNAVLLAILSPEALVHAGLPMGLTLLACLALAFVRRRGGDREARTPHIELTSPF